MAGPELRTVTRGQKILASDWNKIVTHLRSLVSRYFDANYFINLGSKVTLNIRYLQSIIWPWDKVEFGYKINSNAGTVTIYSGYVENYQEVYEVAETVVTIGVSTPAAPHWVYLKVPVENLSGTTIPTTALATRPQGTQSHFQRALYGFSRQNGVIKREKICRVGSQFFPIRIN